MQLPIHFSIAAQDFQGHDEGSTSKAINVGGNTEIVLDLTWKSGSLGNDDVTNVPGASMQLTSRLQKVTPNGAAVILDISESYATPDKQAFMFNKFFVTTQLKDMTAYSAVLRSTGNRKASNSDVEQSVDNIKGILSYQLSCSTSVK